MPDAPLFTPDVTDATSDADSDACAPPWVPQVVGRVRLCWFDGGQRVEDHAAHLPGAAFEERRRRYALGRVALSGPSMRTNADVYSLPEPSSLR